MGYYLMTFRVNRRSDYAIRVLLFLAQQNLDSVVPTRVVRESTLVPDQLMLQIVADLSRAGLIISQPGRNGGLKLGRPAEQINLKEIIEVIDGPADISECINNPGSCPLSPECPVRKTISPRSISKDRLRNASPVPS